MKEEVVRGGGCLHIFPHPFYTLLPLAIYSLYLPLPPLYSFPAPLIYPFFT